jgi:hypothetical protein
MPREVAQQLALLLLLVALVCFLDVLRGSRAAPAAMRAPAPAARSGAAADADPDIGLGTLASPCTGTSPYVLERLERSTDGECKVWLSAPGTDFEQFYSQYHQDAFLFYNFFRCRHTKGAYLDIGAYNPKRFSNTFFYDRCLGWDGICAEADAKRAAPFRTERSCFLVAKAVSIAAGVGSIVGDDWGGTLLLSNHGDKGVATITTMSDLLIEAKWVTNETKGVLTIEFLSLDVESHELEVLMAMPWDRLNIRFIMIENNYATLDEEEFLVKQGYVKLGGMGVDDVFARLEQPARLWWPPIHSAELRDTNALRKKQGYVPYKHAALYRGWDYVRASVAATNAIPLE